MEVGLGCWSSSDRAVRKQEGCSGRGCWFLPGAQQLQRLCPCRIAPTGTSGNRQLRSVAGTHWFGPVPHTCAPGTVPSVVTPAATCNDILPTHSTPWTTAPYKH
jgi:hypothetical protein